jgi:hypothetical protein
VNDDVQRVAEQLVTQVAGELGVQVDAAQVVQLGAAAVGQVSDLISAKAWRDAKAAGNAAAATITTLEQAEDSAKRPR